MTESQIRHDERERCAKVLDEKAVSLAKDGDRHEAHAFRNAAHMLRQIPAAEDAPNLDHFRVEDDWRQVLVECTACHETRCWGPTSICYGLRGFMESHADCPKTHADTRPTVARWLADHDEKQEG